MTKITILLSVLLLTSAPVLAQGNTGKSDTDTCKQVAEGARLVMEARQSGVPMDDIYEIASEDEPYDELIRILAMEAYESPQFSSEQYKMRAITEFRSNHFLRCIKALKK